MKKLLCQFGAKNPNCEITLKDSDERYRIHGNICPKCISFISSHRGRNKPFDFEEFIFDVEFNLLKNG